MDRRTNLAAAGMMSLSMLVFTLNDTLMKLVTEALPLFEAIALRGLLVTAGFALLGLRRGWPQGAAARRDGFLITLRALAEVAATGFFLTALIHMPIANLSAIMQSLPLVVTLGAALYFGEKVSPRQWAAIGAGFAGVLLILRPGGQTFDIWALFGLFSVLAVMVRDLGARALHPETPSWVVACAAALAVTLMGFSGLVFEEWRWPSALAWAYLLGAAGNLFIGYLVSVAVMRQGAVAFVAPFRYTSLLWAILLGAAVFGTFPDLLTLAGAGIVVLSGLYILAHRPQGAAPKGR